MKSLVTGIVVGTVLSASLIGSGGAQSDIPDSVCRGQEVVSIQNVDLKTDRFQSNDVYRFTGGKLYLTPVDRDEYFYNDVRLMEFHRYVSGHKTIIFTGAGFGSATVVHTNEIETQVRKLRCVAQERPR